MIRTRILTEQDRVELLEGWLVQKTRWTPIHNVIVDIAQDAIRKIVPKGWRLRIKLGVTTNDSEVDPDLAIVRGTTCDHFKNHPGPQDIALLGEVADASLEFDRDTKGRAYARAGIRCYWILNILDAQIEVFTDPIADEPTPYYKQCRVFRPSDSIPLFVDGQQVGQIPVADMLPSE
jgi:hypothetical protein